MPTTLYREDFPEECIEALSADDDVTEDLEEWMDDIMLPVHQVSAKEAIDYLVAHNGYDRDDLDPDDLTALHREILVAACRAFNEGHDSFSLVTKPTPVRSFP